MDAKSFDIASTKITTDQVATSYFIASNTYPNSVYNQKEEPNAKVNNYQLGSYQLLEALHSHLHVILVNPFFLQIDSTQAV